MPHGRGSSQHVSRFGAMAIGGDGKEHKLTYMELTIMLVKVFSIRNPRKLV